MTGEWKGITSEHKFVKTIAIESVNGTNFKGVKTIEVKDRNHSKVVVLISGDVIKDQLRAKYGDVVYRKDPVGGKWWTCTDCMSKNILSVNQDSIILTTTIANCNVNCNSVSKYYRRFCEYDSATQVAIANMLGSPSYIAAFSACKEMPVSEDSLKLPPPVSKRRQRQIQDSLNRITAALPPEVVPASQTKTETTAVAKPDTTQTAAAAAVALTKRENVLLETYHITTPDILIEVFDNAQVDGDKVSIYYNNTLIVDNQMLQREPIVYTVHADANNKVHEFVMVAGNLGKMPPNTALMRITVGDQVYKLSVKTDLSTNAKIVFMYDGN